MIPSVEPTLNSLPQLPPRARDGHKGNYGRVLLIGGSRGMAGAIALSGMAALRSGAGLVKLAVPESSLSVAAGFEPALMTTPLAEDEQGRIGPNAKKLLEPLIDAADVIACGPGLGRSELLNELVAWLYSSVVKPMVLDADALNALAAQPELIDHPGGPRVLTPHPGEFSRLVPSAGKQRSEQRRAAIESAGRAKVVMVLKGERSLITNGVRAVENSTGNPGMATGGTGDVLTGVIAALLGQRLQPFAAAQLGAFVHGRAGDLAAIEYGEVSLIASDLIRKLPAAFLERSQSEASS